MTRCQSMIVLQGPPPHRFPAISVQVYSQYTVHLHSTGNLFAWGLLLTLNSTLPHPSLLKVRVGTDLRLDKDDILEFN